MGAEILAVDSGGRSIDILYLSKSSSTTVQKNNPLQLEILHSESYISKSTELSAKCIKSIHANSAHNTEKLQVLCNYVDYFYWIIISVALMLQN